MTETDQLVFEYFSSLGPLARKVMQDQELVRSMYGAEWEQMSFEQRDAVIDEYVIKAEILEHYKTYSRWEDPPEYFPKLKLGSGEKIIVDDDFRTWQDEHSGPFCWETKSQLDMPLFETEEDREKAAKARKRRPRSPDLKKINFNPVKQGKSIWDSPFLAADRGRDSGYPLDMNELGKTPEEMEQDVADSANYEECGEESTNYEECGEASPDSGMNDISPVDQIMASPDKSSAYEETDDLFQKFHISFGSNDDDSIGGSKKKASSPPEPFGDSESIKKSEESSPNYSPVGSPVFSRETKPLVKVAPKPMVKTPPKPGANAPSRQMVTTPPKSSKAAPSGNKRPPPIPLATKPKPKYEPECDDSYEFVEVNRNNNFVASNTSSVENSPIRSIKKDETTALLHSSSSSSTDAKPPTKAAKPARKKHDSSSSNSSSTALLPDESPFKKATSAVVTTQPTPFYDEYEPHGIIDNKKAPDETTSTSSDKSKTLTGFDFLDNW